MTRLATRHLFLPTGKRGELRVRSVREGFELIFVAVFASRAADVVFRLVSRGLGLIGLNGVRRTARTPPTHSRGYEGTDQKRFDEFIQAMSSVDCLGNDPGSKCGEVF